MEENDISKQILDAAIAVHKTLGGPGLLESVYRDSLMHELRLRNLKAEKEVSVPVVYKGVKVGDPLRIDILVEGKIVVECKATEKDNPVFASQTLTYLRLINLHLGIINFGKEKVVDGYQRVINGYDTSDPSCLRASVLKPTPTQSPILDWQAKARNDGFMLTNLYPDPRKMDDWMRREAAVAVTGFADCRLLVVHEGDFDRLFYAAESLEAASKACASYAALHKIDCVLDVVGPQSAQAEAAAQFCECGFVVRKTLTRMQRRKGFEPYEITTAAVARPTTAEDAVHIHAALHQFFDPRAEQLPCMEEVLELCTNGSSFAACVGNVVCSFLLDEIQGKKGTIRYWFTTPEGRGKGTGGVLMHAFFDHCLEKDVTFQELWVIDDNDNAIKRYEHYGFAFDRLKDSVFFCSSELKIIK